MHMSDPPLMTVVTVTDTSTMTSQPYSSSTNARIFATCVVDTPVTTVVTVTDNSYVTSQPYSSSTNASMFAACVANTV